MPKKQCSTKATESTSAKIVQPLPSGEEFRAYVRAEAVRGSQLLLEETMKAELTALLGCEWGKAREAGQGYRLMLYLGRLAHWRFSILLKGKKDSKTEIRK
jgi:hypothetical protein